MQNSSAIKRSHTPIATVYTIDIPFGKGQKKPFIGNSIENSQRVMTKAVGWAPVMITKIRLRPDDAIDCIQYRTGPKIL